MTTGKKGVFLDTFFVQALLNRRDQYHVKAKALFPQVRKLPMVWTTEAVLIEVGNALASINREGATEFIRGCYNTPNLKNEQVDALNDIAIEDMSIEALPKRTRAVRRHHRNRIIQKRRERVQRGRWFVRGYGYLAKNNTVCSCWMCGNPRRYFGEPTRQEKKAACRYIPWTSLFE